MRAILATKWRTVSPRELAVLEGISTPVPLPLRYARNILLQDLLYQWKSEWDSANTSRLLHELLTLLMGAPRNVDELLGFHMKGLASLGLHKWWGSQSPLQ
ncbi:hypothetical protein AVEN_33147-1 [Araneus ventricosus]|uniref:Uncharacterized protein n=1 Tax=Araneus ventricosus TaxID=182803 RepID=A0A4Y2LGE8_ARAVE|nr:hypothetical protein AVEN_33147-1 [Araneus ventricosus]